MPFLTFSYKSVTYFLISEGLLLDIKTASMPSSLDCYTRWMLQSGLLPATLTTINTKQSLGLLLNCELKSYEIITKTQECQYLSE